MSLMKSDFFRKVLYLVPIISIGVRIGSPICEDAWHPDVCEAQIESGAEIFMFPMDLRIVEITGRAIASNDCTGCRDKYTIGIS